MRVVSFANQKGGVGKTTLVAHTAVAIERAGLGPVALIDLDPQASLSNWWNKREAETPAFADPGELAGLAGRLEQLKDNGFRWVLIDTPPAAGPTNVLAVKVSDLVVIPSRASPHDLEALGSTIATCQAEEKPFIFALNGVKAGAGITSQAVAMLSEHGPVAPALIGDRVAYATSMIDGRTLTELDGKGKGADEIGSLVEFLKDRFPEFKQVKKEKARV